AVLAVTETWPPRSAGVTIAASVGLAAMRAVTAADAGAAVSGPAAVCVTVVPLIVTLIVWPRAKAGVVMVSTSAVPPTLLILPAVTRAERVGSPLIAATRAAAACALV